MCNCNPTNLIVDKSFLLFIFQFLTSLTLISFCIAMLSTGQNVAVYLPILTATTGYWLPSPEIPSSITSPTTTNTNEDQDNLITQPKETTPTNESKV
jgi:hypothetical protein